jgi:DNA-binding beta-propeller fold protein YncE
VFVNIEDTGEVVAFDAKKLRIVARWPIAPCTEPSGLALDRAHSRLFSVCDKVMAVSDAASHRMIKTLTIGDGPDGAAFDAARSLAFSSNGADGTLTIVRETSRSRFDVVQTLPTQRGARTIALDERTHRLYLPTAQFGPPPAPTADRPHPRPSVVPGTFEILEVGE